MKNFLLAALLCSSFLLSGCSLMNREYSTVTPHSAGYYESGSDSVLRAENYQDLVNDILLLVGQHAESGTVSLYPEEETQDLDSLISMACREVQTDTPMGSYAVDFLTYTLSEQHNYVEISLSLSYRRSAQQMDSMIRATSLSALQSLLTTAVEENHEELVLQVSYFSDDVQALYDTVAELQTELEHESAAPWEVNLYPSEGTVRIVEIILKS